MSSDREALTFSEDLRVHAAVNLFADTVNNIWKLCWQVIKDSLLFLSTVKN